MDVFTLRNKVVEDYQDYLRSFVDVRADDIRRKAEEEVQKGTLWPDALLQLNPAFELVRTLPELVQAGILQPASAAFFRKPNGDPITLYRHQEEALALAQSKKSYVVTTGTGSGKSLTYLLPIFDEIAKHPDENKVRAIIVYPMNALINSQHEALERYAKSAAGTKVRFSAYTGQTSNEERHQLMETPPHILLTNYVMLELMLTRPAERVFVDRVFANITFLVLDEMHTYRGRSGSDVAMLIRRLKQRCGNPNLQCIGTSATVATEGGREARKAAAAAVASKLFGTEVDPSSVVDETIQRVCTVEPPTTMDQVAAAVRAPLPAQGDKEAFIRHPLASWAEWTFGIHEEDGRLVRQTPVAFAEGVRRLGEQSGLPAEQCERTLRALLDLGSELQTTSGDPLFAFRLHQFVSGGGTMYATFEESEARTLTTEPQYVVKGRDGQEKVLFPLEFCRECGQEYYLVYRDDKAGQILPRFADDEDDDAMTRRVPGYLALDASDIWTPDDEANLPDQWYEWGASGKGRLKQGYQDVLPDPVRVTATGDLGDKGVLGIFLGKPFRLCPRCGATYSARAKRDYRKITPLWQAGRSSATTVLTSSVITQMNADTADDPEPSKILSFTDNRQDASLQAGHFNDFIRMAILRAAILKAVRQSGSQDNSTIARAVFEALGLPQEAYARNPAQGGPGRERNEKALTALIEYWLYEDLMRGWRVVQPNLEQCGLLRIDYKGLREFCAEDSPWQGDPILSQTSPERREFAVRAMLDHMRQEFAISADVLTKGRQDELRRISEDLIDPWAFDHDERLQESVVFIESGKSRRSERSMSDRSALGNFLRRPSTWGIQTRITPADYANLIDALVATLKGNFLAEVQGGGFKAWQVQASAMLWLPSDGSVPALNPVRSQRMRARDLGARRGNDFFTNLYDQAAEQLAGVEGREHTAQIATDERILREIRFRAIQAELEQHKVKPLQAMFCSPTMELGVDISDLSVVHMRNVPPTPANYAQRSGRAGRGGRPALIITSCSELSPHDRTYFQSREKMVAGAVQPARFDLANESLVEAHLHAMWMAFHGLNLGDSVMETVNVGDSEFPLLPGVLQQIEQTKNRERFVAQCLAMLASAGPEVADLFPEEKVRRVADEALSRFDAAFDRWRALYRASVEQRDQARRLIDDPRFSRDLRQNEQMERAANRQIQLLLNQDTRSRQSPDSDYYPYRYLAAEGFLPGYNFPALPLRVVLANRADTASFTRARAQALGEFGPENFIYHDGQKYMVERCLSSGPEDLQRQQRQPKVCSACGYIHVDDNRDLCENCGGPLSGQGVRYTPTLFVMDKIPVRAVARERITCDEEERNRRGYEITVHYRYARRANGEPMRRSAKVRSTSGQDLLGLTEALQASVWRVNRRWRVQTQEGFAVDATTGEWLDSGHTQGSRRDRAVQAGHDILAPVAPAVEQIQNLLLLKAPQEIPGAGTDAFAHSLAHAIKRGITAVYELEDNEILVDLIGEGDLRSIMVLENAEGGVGVVERIMAEPDAFRRIAAAALERLHFDPDGKDIADGNCLRACYDCLLDYSNQRVHKLLDRQSVRDFLLLLAGATTEVASAGRDRDAQYAYLMERMDHRSDLEKQFLQALYEAGAKLPDKAQYRPEEDVYAEADYFYERNGAKGICVFCDGPQHDEARRAERDKRERGELEDRGYRVVTIRYDRQIREQVEPFE